MKTNLTYSEAFLKLEDLVEKLEEGNIPLDGSTTVKHANELISICEVKLRGISTEVNEATKNTKKGQRKK